MKKYLKEVVSVLSLFVAAHITSAAVFLTDDFTVTAQSLGDPNFEIADGRQAGLNSPSTYTRVGFVVSDQNAVQLGNPETDVGQPGGISNSNYLLLAGYGALKNDLVIDDTLVGGTPLTITFDLYTQGNHNADTDWMGFSLSAPTSDSSPVAGVGEFGMLVRQNGGIQMFNDTDGAGGAFYEQSAGFTTSSFWSFTFSDLAGTGSAFSGAGSMVTVYNGSNLVGTFELSSQLLTTGLEVGFYAENTMVGGVDNLSISTVPEPSTFLLLGAGAGCLLIRRRRKLA